jgi:hypothetical protein
MLYLADRHEALDEVAWDEAAARREIAAIVRDTEDAYTPHAFWPQHPRDEFAEGEVPQKALYLGAAGVLWALERFGSPFPIDAVWRRAAGDYLARPDMGAVVPSWFCGRSFLLAREPDDLLYECIAGNIANPTWEMLWGSPGTMLGALAAFEKTGETRWRDLYVRNADALWDAWRDEIWTQDLYGHKVAYYGAGHGFAGNAYALLKGAHLLPETRRAALLARVERVTRALARRANGMANWAPMPGSERMLLQWCHGAPGFILCLAPFVPGLTDLLREGGELIWHAGPLKKGACFCHGTDGNGMALLALYQRTGEVRWLERARRFAMHAIRQSRESLAAVGRRRYTLWTGDLGLAVFLDACIRGEACQPGL